MYQKQIRLIEHSFLFRRSNTEPDIFFQYLENVRFNVAPRFCEENAWKRKENFSSTKEQKA